MKILMTIIVVISAIGLIATVLLQSGKSAGLSGAITGGAETFFGKKGMDDKFATWSKIFAGVCIYLVCGNKINRYMRGRYSGGDISFFCTSFWYNERGYIIKEYKNQQCFVI